LTPAANAPTRLDPEELQQANEAVAKTVAPFGLEPDPRLGTVMHDSRADEEWTELVLGLYSAGATAPTKHRVSVWVLEDKRTHEYRVVIRDLDGLRQTDFTKKLEAALVAALSKLGLTRTIAVESETVGPAFGP